MVSPTFCRTKTSPQHADDKIPLLWFLKISTPVASFDRRARRYTSLFSAFLSNSALALITLGPMSVQPWLTSKKGLTNMLRLHATGAVALPIEVRLQVLASSRDVIHSWALPSAGIKIDCVPGYTSHKIMIFLMEGIYWGQCMEICGRYHHWMPIILYFMRRDLFFLWCSHFIFNSNLSYLWDINDRQYSDHLRYVSYDKTAWLNEINL